MHPQSIIHVIIQFNDGMIKIIAHETTMDIPIRNTIYTDEDDNLKRYSLNFKKLNKACFLKVNFNKFPSVKIVDMMPKKISLFETVLVTANDEFVKLFLDKRIKYREIIEKTLKTINKSEYKVLKKILPRNISDVINTSEIVRSKIKSSY